MCDPADAAQKIWKAKYAGLCALALALLLSLLPFTAKADSKDATALLTNLTSAVAQNGAPIPDGGKIDGSSPLSISFSFGVPVKGDGGAEGTYISHGDTASFELARGFSYSGASSFDLTSQGEKIGTLTIQSTGTGLSSLLTASVLFDGNTDVFDGLDHNGQGAWSNVNCQFSCTLNYAGTGADAAEGDHAASLFGKSFTVNIPVVPATVTAEKTGVRGSDARFIDWAVKVTAKKNSADAPLDLYTVQDALAGVGAYQPGSFKVGTLADGSDAVAVSDAAVYDAQNGVLTYSFANGETGTRYVFFSTAIPQEKLMAAGEQSITNTAQILEGATPLTAPAATVRFTTEWIKKEVASSAAEHLQGSIRWTITANQSGAALTNATITDVLDSRLVWDSAALKTWDSTSGTWVASGTSFSAAPAGGVYSLGTIATPVQLTITAHLDAAQNAFGHIVYHIENQAALAWEGQPDILSGKTGTNIGINPISKTAGAYDRASRTLPWTVTIQKSDVTASLRVLDLIVYGDSGFGSTANYTGYTLTLEGAAIAGGDLRNADTAVLKELTPRYRQHYIAGSFASASGLDYAVYTVKDSAGTAVADLLVAAGTGGVGIDPSTANQSYTYKTEVTDPAWYMGNTEFTAYNTAALYSANTKINEATATAKCTPSAIEKDVLSRTEAAKLTATASDAVKLAAANCAPGSAENSFNYTDKTVVFRLHVNANGISVPASGLSTAGNHTLSDITAADVLPAGWEFVPFADGAEYLAFSGDSASGKRVTANTLLAAGSEVTAAKTPATAAAGETYTFTFSELKGGYVILVRAKPTDAAAIGYFNQNGSTTVKNATTLHAQQYPALAADYEDVKITSTLLDKTYQTVNGALRWTVDYKPAELPHVSTTLSDTLPLGVDVRIQANGALDLTAGNITITKLVLNADGSYTAGSSVAVDATNVSYDTASRVLAFHLADTKQAYRFTYLTDVTANGGVNLNNNVTLVTGSGTKVSASRAYAAQAADASAVMQRSGYIILHKKDDQGVALSGAEFTIYAQNPNGSINETVVIRTGTTDATGELTLRGLPVGSYYLKETKAPAGHLLSTATHRIEISKDGAGHLILTVDGTEKANKTLEIINYALGSVSVQSLAGDTNAALAGAKLELWKKGGTTPIESWTTTQNGYTLSQPLADGEYILKETAAPAGYSLAAALAFTVQNGVIITTGVANNTLVFTSQRTPPVLPSAPGGIPSSTPTASPAASATATPTLKATASPTAAPPSDAATGSAQTATSDTDGEKSTAAQIWSFFNPRTGDTTHLPLWKGLLAFAITGLLCMAIPDHRGKHRKKKGAHAR